MAYAGCRGSAPARRNPLSASRWIASTAAAQRVNSGHRSILWPRDSRSSTTSSGNRSSNPNRPARYSNGANESGKLHVENRGALIASCTSIPKWKTFRNTCSIACTCMSPPGQPNVNSAGEQREQCDNGQQNHTEHDRVLGHPLAGLRLVYSIDPHTCQRTDGGRDVNRRAPRTPPTARPRRSG